MIGDRAPLRVDATRKRWPSGWDCGAVFTPVFGGKGSRWGTPLSKAVLVVITGAAGGVEQVAPFGATLHVVGSDRALLDTDGDHIPDAFQR